MHPAPLGRHRANGRGEQEQAGGPFDTTALLLALAIQSLGEPHDVDVVLKQTLELGCELAGASHAMLAIVGPEGEVARVLTHGEPTAGSSLAVPLLLDGQQIGTFHLTGRARPFGGADAQLVGVLTQAAVGAVARARATREAVAADRARIACDLHDQVSQRLYAIGLRLEALRPRLDAGSAATVEAAVLALDEALRDLRGSVYELKQPPGSMVGRVRELVREYADPLGFAPRLRLTGSLGGVDADIAEQLLPSLREALSNVVRHAGASRVDVDLDASSDWLMLRVEDDGVGIGPGAAPGSGLGNLRHRAEQLGGVMRLTPARPKGTRLEWLVPLAR